VIKFSELYGPDYRESLIALLRKAEKDNNVSSIHFILDRDIGVSEIPEDLTSTFRYIEKPVFTSLNYPVRRDVGISSTAFYVDANFISKEYELEPRKSFKKRYQ